MSKKYKQIKFSKLDGGIGQDYYDASKPNKLKTCIGLEPDQDNQKLKLAENLFKTTHENLKSTALKPISSTYQFSTLERCYILLRSDTNSRVELKFLQTPIDTLHEQFNFADGSTSPYMVVLYEGILMCWLDDSGLKLYADETAPYTAFVENTDWVYSIPLGYFLTDDSILYIYTADEIVKTSDGTTFTLVYESPTEYDIKKVRQLDGEIYFTLTNYTHNDQFLKFGNDDEPKVIRQFKKATLSDFDIFDNKIIIVNKKGNTILFYEWDKSDLKYITSYSQSGVAQLNILHSDEFYIYIVVDYTNLLRINRKNGLYTVKLFSENICNIDNFGGNITVYTYDDNEDKFYVYTGYEYSSAPRITSGVFTTPAILKRHTPAYLILKHKPIGDNGSVIIKSKIDQASTFATTLMTNTVNSSVRTVVALKDLLNKCSSIEFEVTVADSSNDGEVEDIELIYLYELLGIENSI